MATPGQASPSDVRAEYNTYLDDPDINTQLERASREILRHNDVSGWDQEHLDDLEATYAAYRIATRIDRAAISTQSGRSSTDYEESVIEELRRAIEELDESGELLDDHRPSGTYEVY